MVMMSQVSKLRQTGVPLGSRGCCSALVITFCAKVKGQKANLKTDEDVYPKPPAGWIFCPFVD